MYPSIPDRVGRSVQISFEILESLFKDLKQYGITFIHEAKKSITDPYRSARGIMEGPGKLNIETNIIKVKL